MVESYLYALVDPRDDEVRYIGITTRPDKRYYGHLNDACKNTGSHKRAWIRSLTNEGLTPIFSVIASGNMTRKQLCALEIASIAQYTVDGHALTNVTEGGDGLYGFAAPRTPAWNENLREAIARHNASLSTAEKTARAAKRIETIKAKNNGVYPGLTKGRQSPMKGRKTSEETKAKMRAAHRARWEKLKAEGRYDEVCANIAAGTKHAMNAGASS